MPTLPMVPTEAAPAVAPPPGAALPGLPGAPATQAAPPPPALPAVPGAPAGLPGLGALDMSTSPAQVN
jgi:hypothetical protein